jgi:hypothetical protein
MTCKSFLLGVTLLFAACGNYSNEDLEFMNAIPAGEDIAANIPPSHLLPANEAELSRETHEVITTFNGLLDFLKGADTIRTFEPTSRVPNGRVWGPYSMADHPGWVARFTMMRNPNTPTRFDYAFDVEPAGAGDAGWIRFIDGWFLGTGGARLGMGHFTIHGDGVRVAGFGVNPGPDGNLFKELTVDYSTAGFPVSVAMTLVLYPGADLNAMVTITYTYEQQEDGRAGMEFEGTDSRSGAMLDVKSRWLATGRGRADAYATDGTVSGTRTECWNDAFMETYNNTPWDLTPGVNHGDLATDCPDISAL